MKGIKTYAFTLNFIRINPLKRSPDMKGIKTP